MGQGGIKSAVYSTPWSYFNLVPARVWVTAERGFIRRSASVDLFPTITVCALFIGKLILFSCRKDDAMNGHGVDIEPT